jgi:hypothetical protein
MTMRSYNEDMIAYEKKAYLSAARSDGARQGMGY